MEMGKGMAGVYRHDIKGLQKIEDIVKKNGLLLIPKNGLRKIWATKRRSRKR